MTPVKEKAESETTKPGLKSLLSPKFVLVPFLFSICGLCEKKRIKVMSHHHSIVGSQPIYCELRSCTTLALGGQNLSRQASTVNLGKHVEKTDEVMSLLD